MPRAARSSTVKAPGIEVRHSSRCSTKRGGECDCAPKYRAWIADGTFGPGYASEDGVGLHYIGTDLYEAVTIREGKNAWYVDRSGDGGYDEKAIPARLI